MITKYPKFDVKEISLNEFTPRDDVVQSSGLNCCVYNRYYKHHVNPNRRLCYKTAVAAVAAVDMEMIVVEVEAGVPGNKSNLSLEDDDKSYSIKLLIKS